MDRIRLSRLRGPGRRGGPLTAAAGQYDRSARELWGGCPHRRKPVRGCAPRRRYWRPRGSSAGAQLLSRLADDHHAQARWERPSADGGSDEHSIYQFG